MMQFDLFEAEARKAIGIDLVWKNNAAWIEHGVMLADRYLPHGHVMGDQLQTLPGIGKPTSSAAWGALTQACKAAKILIGTGRIKKSTLTTNHAHKYEVYWRPGYPQRGEQ